MIDEPHMPGCAALLYKANLPPGPCNCLVGRLRAESESLKKERARDEEIHNGIYEALIDAGGCLDCGGLGHRKNVACGCPAGKLWAENMAAKQDIESLMNSLNVEVIELERLREAIRKVIDEIEHGPVAIGEPGESVQLGRFQVIDELRAALKEK